MSRSGVHEALVDAGSPPDEDVPLDLEDQLEQLLAKADTEPQWFITDGGHLCIHCPCGGNTGDYHICAGCGRQWNIVVSLIEIADLPGKSEPEAYAELAAKAGLTKSQEIEHEYTPCPDCNDVDGHHFGDCQQIN